MLARRMRMLCWRSKRLRCFDMVKDAFHPIVTSSFFFAGHPHPSRSAPPSPPWGRPRLPSPLGKQTMHLRMRCRGRFVNRPYRIATASSASNRGGSKPPPYGREASPRHFRMRYGKKADNVGEVLFLPRPTVGRGPRRYALRNSTNQKSSLMVDFRSFVCAPADVGCRRCNACAEYVHALAPPLPLLPEEGFGNRGFWCVAEASL